MAVDDVESALKNVGAGNLYAYELLERVANGAEIESDVILGAG